MIARTAQDEAQEEFLNDQFNNTRINYYPPLTVEISIVRGVNKINSLNFISPIKLTCSKIELEKILNTNSAIDKNEHTEKFIAILLNSSNQQTITGLIDKKIAGDFLYKPIINFTSSMVEKLI